MAPDPREPPLLAGLAADARYARERYDLYRQKQYSGRDTNGSRMREYERAWLAAEKRLATARKDLPPADQS